MNKIILQTVLVISTLLSLFSTNSIIANPKAEIQVESGIYIFVSFSLNDNSLRSYFTEANRCGAKLIMRGLTGDKSSRNRFAITKSRMEKARINVDINPNLFKQFNITKVPAVVVVNQDQSIKKISGHITLSKALELMNVRVSNKNS